MYEGFEFWKILFSQVQTIKRIQDDSAYYVKNVHIILTFG